MIRCDVARVGSAMKTAPVHLYLIPVGRRIELPEFPPSNVHFDIDQDHQVAAASLAVWDKDDDVRQWMTVGDVGRDTNYSTAPSSGTRPTCCTHCASSNSSTTDTDPTKASPTPDHYIHYHRQSPIRPRSPAKHPAMSPSGRHPQRVQTCRLNWRDG
jgi:hypothetical protein